MRKPLDIALTQKQGRYSLDFPIVWKLGYDVSLSRI